jgi:RNA polymerase sigma-70 factor (ECF subfamily)
VAEESDAALIADSLHDPAHFGPIFDRHATVLHRYLVRRIGADEADGMVGEVFRIAFEKRHSYDLERPTARPWLYGIATNLLAKHRRSESRRLHAVARLAAQRLPPADLADHVTSSVDASVAWEGVAAAVAGLPEPERDALVLHVWEGLPYEEVAAALGIPVGTVRSRMNRARRRLRELAPVSGRDPGEGAAQLRPDRIEPDDPGDPQTFSQVKEELMSTIDTDHVVAASMATPDIYPRLAYRDELAAIEYLTRVFQFEENREARMEFDGHYLAWLRMGSGIIMLGHQNVDVHLIHSPLDAGLTTVIMHVYVHDIDAHYAHAVAEGADITMELDDAFYGERRYEATDPEGHRWHFGERFAEIRARGGRPPEPGDPPAS